MDHNSKTIQTIEQILATKKLGLRFPEPFETNFKEDYSYKYHYLLISALALGTALFLLSFVFDLFFASHLITRLVMRCFLVLPAIIACIVYINKKHNHTTTQILIALSASLIVTGIIINGHFSPPILQRIYYTAILLVLVYLGAPTYVEFTYTIVIIIYTFIIFNIFMLLDLPVTKFELFAFNYLYIGGAIIATSTSYFAEKFRRSQYLREQLISLQAKQNSYLAQHDTITDLANRNLFNTIMHEIVKTREHSDRYMALFYLDLDNFKAINDNYGHHYGDLLLKEVGKRLKNIFRKEDLISRMSGDEFTILVKNIKNFYQISPLAKKIIGLFQENFNLTTIETHITASMGISVYPLNSKNPDELVKQADLAMYRAKQRGRNNFQFYQENIDAKYRKQLKIANELQLALQRDELYLVYQPIINNKTQKILGMEVLLRWESKLFKEIPPDTFIPIAEFLGLINEFGLWVMEQAFKQYKKWYDSFTNLGFLTFNLSAMQLTTKDIINDIKKLTAKYKIPPENIGIEITETSIMNPTSIAKEIMKELYDLGYKILIDDFGTGFSSFERLKDLKIHALKIDKAFISDISKNAINEQIIKSMIDLAANLNLAVIAEGVENKIQQQFLKQNNCNYMQGFLYAKPMRNNKMEQFIQESS